jgi:hypothetical protein
MGSLRNLVHNPLAENNLPPGFWNVDIARILRVRLHQIHPYLQFQIHSQIENGERCIEANFSPKPNTRGVLRTPYFFEDLERLVKSYKTEKPMNFHILVNGTDGHNYGTFTITEYH